MREPIFAICLLGQNKALHNPSERERTANTSHYNFTSPYEGGDSCFWQPDSTLFMRKRTDVKSCVFFLSTVSPLLQSGFSVFSDVSSQA